MEQTFKHFNGNAKLSKESPFLQLHSNVLQCIASVMEEGKKDH